MMIVHAQVGTRGQAGQPATCPLLTTGFDGGSEVLIKMVLRTTNSCVVKMPNMRQKLLEFVERRRFERVSNAIQLDEVGQRRRNNLLRTAGRRQMTLATDCETL
jgi:hypothetical protein